MRIEADLLIPGRGEPVRDGVVVVQGARILYAGGRAGAPHSDEPVTRVGTVLPGLWDCHAHFLGLRDLDIEQVMREPQALLAARATKSAEAVLRAGFTSVREVGGFGVFLASAVDEGIVNGPTIYGAGAVLSQTGGHGDSHGMPLGMVADYSAHGGAMQLCDGISECQKAVRL